MNKKTFIQLFLCFLALAAVPLKSQAQIISTFAGCGIGDDSLATKAELVGPVGVAVDKLGNTFIVDAGSYRVRKIDGLTGVITTIAGSGVYGHTGDGGPATSATMGVMYGIAVDQAENVYVVDQSYSCVRKISASGTITTIAGTGITGYSGDGGPAIAATFNNPIDIVVDPIGNLYVTDWQNNVVRKIDTAGMISTAVGDGNTFGGTGSGGLATASELGAPFRLAMDRSGNLYVAEVQYQCICRVDTFGILTIIADTTGTYATGLDGDGSFGLSATMTSPCGLAVDTNNNLYFSDIGNFRIRKLNMTTGIISEYAASGVAGYSGDGLLATTAKIGSPEGLAIDLSGNLLICDPDNNRIRKVDPLGIMSTVAGQSGLFSDGYAALNSEMCIPANICTDASGNVYFADYYNNRIRKIDPVTGIMTTVAGSGSAGYMFGFSGDGGPATLASIYNPAGVAVDAAGNIYIADQSNSRVRKVDAATGTISTIAGNGTASFSGDGGPAISASLYEPSGVAVDTAGNVYIADELNSRVRKVTPAGVISTVAGTGTAGFSGDGGPATGAKLTYPTDVSTDNAGNLYIADVSNSCIRKVNAAGIISSLTMHSTAGGFSGDGGPAAAAELSFPSGVKADNNGNVFISDGNNQRIRYVNAAGIINTIAGNGTAGYSGDGGLATAARLNGPAGVAVDNAGNMYIADGNNFRIRKVTDYLSVASAQVTSGSVQAYPNPAHNIVYVAVSSSLTGQEQVVLMNAVGQEVYHAPLLLNKQPIDISALASGVYMLQITNNSGEKKVVKIVKE